MAMSGTRHCCGVIDHCVDLRQQEHMLCRFADHEALERNVHMAACAHRTKQI